MGKILIPSNSILQPILGKIDFLVEGDMNHYYPCIISMNGFAWNKISVYRGYKETAPENWGTDDTHLGALTLTFHWTGDSDWGGNLQDIWVDEFHENYSKMIGGLQLTKHEGICVWLRGGGAIYHIQSDNPTIQIDVTDGDWTDILGNIFSVRTYDASVVKTEVKNKNVLLRSYPVGSYYWSDDATSPEILFGGTWTQIKDRFVYAASSKSNLTGGSSTINLSHYHTTGNHTLTTDEIPSHTHNTVSPPIYNSEWEAGENVYAQQESTAKSVNRTTWSTGGGKAHNHGNTDTRLDSSTNILPPYITAFCWKRIA